MISYFRDHLQGKLLLSYLAIILASALVLVLTSRLTIDSAFQNHLGRMQQSQLESGGAGTGEGTGLMYGAGADKSDFDIENSPGMSLYANFQASFREALLWASVAALFVALILSFLLSRRVVAPVRAMMIASRSIAEGHYDERVGTHGSDELGQLAQSFNQMATELEKTEEMRRQLIGDVAHELRTPLTTIKGSVEALEDGILPASPETYELILHEADRLNHLVDDLQELSRVEAGAYELIIQPLQLSSLTGTIEKRFGTQFKEKGIKFERIVPANLPTIQADERRLIQILSNLLTNALYYTPEGGDVRLEASHIGNGNDIQISIKDNGIGIPPEHLKNIFTRFYRVDKSRSRHAGGSGIGLTITKHLVKAHGGEIWVESEGKDRGSTFVFTLPVAIK
ncbi:MAG: HAMP domain-containing protein [Anaerolineae bacterium]|jgi:histidine kinase|nr:HAMP domain-containing protein [Anaerolineae bacterium]MBT4312600.1 HAMP domain-containing protein [Anaerolineae bacterium]MBT4456726.1 HAMP domain-containing protein [Anaerolineae bacterium]MBT4841526.1 HAMP domain-containing protein [Anaerolineae bacterium]MBT6060914.1 HAMP domain-containing protein [Anaerolineae bacterium]